MAPALTRIPLLTITLLFFYTPSFSFPSDEEIILSFSHPAVGQYSITAVYSNNSFYLPVTELFNLLYVHYEKGSTGQSLQGTWQGEDNNWQINTNTLQAKMGKEYFTLTAADFRLGELDLYLSPALFERMFGLRFTVNMNALSVSLQSDKTLPVEEKKQHEKLRKEMERKRDNERDFPMLYPRNRKIAGAGMADYNLGMYADNSGVSGAYSVTGGMELLGGDVQGTVYGTVGKTSASVRALNLTWRYVPDDNPFLTYVKTGQLGTTGLLGQSILGGAIGNDPIEPRKTFDSYSLDGHTIPESEVELYINNQLSDFTRADELGYYRFSFSLTYGRVRVNLRISTPSGQIITEDRQMQIPFTFLPKGVVSYNLQGGIINNGRTDITFDKYALHGDVAWGLSKTLTAKAGADYLSYGFKPLYYASLSARLFDQFLLNIDAAPCAFYRGTASVTYASSRNYSLVYTRFDSDSLYNPRRARQELEGSVYMPFTLLGRSSGLRLGGENYLYNKSSLTNYNLDFNTHLGRFNFRVNYRDQINTTHGKTFFGNGIGTGAITYTFSHAPTIPVFVKGMFLSIQTRYEIHNNRMATAAIQFSRTVWRKGRLNVNIDHDLRGGTTRVQAGFSFDLDAFRSNTQYTGSGNHYVFQQTFNSSAGLDANSAKLTVTKLEQVGRASVSVLMFIDSNQNGKYDGGEEKVPSRAIRLDEFATFELGKDSILRITQLQSYWKYNATIVQTDLPDPTLAPSKSEFSFVTDPNRYKRIEIPLYRTGTIEGKIILFKKGGKEGMGGIRLLLKGLDRTYEETLRTFSDGSYYAMNLLPGKYELAVDPAQLNFLGAISEPRRLEFTVKALAEGDYLEGLNIILEQENLPFK